MINYIDKERGEFGRKNIRTNILSDSRFYTMVEDIYNPPEWAVYFGLVKIVDKPTKAVVYNGAKNRPEYIK